MTRLCVLLLSTAFAGVCLFSELAISADAPKETIKLFNGKDLTNFYTWLGKSPKADKPYGKNNDPEKVFTVKDDMIRVSGEVFGGFITEKEYENYHLFVEFKWGEKTYAPREKKTRDSGILLHCVGEDGAAGGVWMESIECQMIEGGTGDFILVGTKTGGTPKLTCEVENKTTYYKDKDGKEATREDPYYKPGGKAREFKGGRINWYGRDPKWVDELGFRGKEDVEKKVGEWNTLECICDGDSITNILNGKVVNKGTKASHTKGKILFQSEGAELFFKTIELRPIKK